MCNTCVYIIIKAHSNMYSVNIGVNLQMGWVVRETMIIIMTRTPQKIFGKNLKRCRDELAKKGWRQGRDG